MIIVTPLKILTRDGAKGRDVVTWGRIHLKNDGNMAAAIWIR